MRGFRFSIASLLVFILICGVAFAALKESSDLWDSGVFTVTLGALLVSVLLAIYRSGARRSFWVGFALFGGSYLALSLIAPLEGRLITSKALAFLHSKLPGQPPATVAFVVHCNGSGALSQQQLQTITLTGSGNQTNSAGQAVFRVWNASTGKLLGGWGSSTENFVRIGHSVLALLLAWFGGLLSRRLSCRRDQPRCSVPIEVPG